MIDKKEKKMRNQIFENLADSIIILLYTVVNTIVLQKCIAEFLNKFNTIIIMIENKIRLFFF